jgi:hypothetical protein
LLLQSQKSVIHTALAIDWVYLSTMTNGFDCLDLRTMVNTSAMYAVQQQTSVHTTESILFALGHINSMHDLPETQFKETRDIGFFDKFALEKRKNPLVQNMSFFTQTGQIPLYKKLMHIFRLMLPTETPHLAQRWHQPTADETLFYDRTDRGFTIADGLLPLFCEGLFVYNIQTTCDPSYPVVAFDSYGPSLFTGLWNMFDEICDEYSVETVAPEKLFISQFNRWRSTATRGWAIDLTSQVKPLGLRVNGTATWKSDRIDTGYALVIANQFPELDSDRLFGAMSIQKKIRTRLAFFLSPDDVASMINFLPKTYDGDDDDVMAPGEIPLKYRVRLVQQAGLEFATLMQKQWSPSVPDVTLPVNSRARSTDR